MAAGLLDGPAASVRRVIRLLRANPRRSGICSAQFDFDGQNRYSDQYYEQATGRGIIGWRGPLVRTEEGKSPGLLATLGDKDELGGYVKIEDRLRNTWIKRRGSTRPETPRKQPAGRFACGRSRYPDASGRLSPLFDWQQ